MSAILKDDGSRLAVPKRFVDAEDALRATAIEMSGCSDFGDTRYLTGLRVLLQALDSDCRLTPEGRDFAFFELVLTLNARLATQRGWTENPELLKTAIHAPLVITGLPRSCTTVLHRLLAVDPQFQGLESWLTNAPMPRPPREEWERLAAFRRTGQRLQRWFDTVPQFRMVHDMAVDDMEECIEVLRQDFVSNRFGCNFPVPSYDRWWMAEDDTASFRRYADVLRLIGGREPDRRWLLKNPGDIYAIDALLAVFPDARIIYTHRDPLKSMPSVASLIHMAHQMAEGPAASKNTGPREVEVWSRGTQPMLAARARHPDQFHDVTHGDYVRDPLAVVRGIYDRFGLVLIPEVERAMQAWVAANPPGKHGEHRYTLEEYGLTEASVRDCFRDYYDAYGPF
ncbi:sulfotransferase family protein [Flavisphingomonas formosensis]|uniref:sulfotransferase family protein n=1 Tax=Flavisphingomonas formosensis TaxID=861534 RepID=UPI0012F9120D|nr:sulfotransferase [Sphingomonas formosensis]